MNPSVPSQDVGGLEQKGLFTLSWPGFGFVRSLAALLRCPVGIASITPICLGKDDVIVFRCEGKLQPEQVARLRKHFAQIWPGQKSLILDGGMSLQVMRTPSAKEPA